MRHCWIIFVFAFFASEPASAQLRLPRTSPATQNTSQYPGPPAPVVEAPVTDAERIARLQRSIAETQKQLDELSAKLNDPKSEYKLAEADFGGLDQKLAEQRKRLAAIEEAGTPEKIQAAQQDVKDFEERWTLARKRFDLAIEENKTQQEQIAALSEKLRQDADALAKLRGTGAPASQPAASTTESASPVAANPAPSAGPAGNGTTALAPPVGQPTVSIPGLPTLPTMPAPVPAAAKPASPEIVKAQEAVAQKTAEADEADENVQSVEERISALRRALLNEEKLLNTAQQQTDNAQATERALYDELQRELDRGAPAVETRELRERLTQARSRLQAARGETRDRGAHIEKLQDELRELEAERAAAEAQAEEIRGEAKLAAEQLRRLESPFAWHNIRDWLLTHGVRIVGILLVAALLLWGLSKGDRRLAQLLVARHQRGSIEERQNRANTLVGVFHNAASIAIVIGAGLMTLTELNINIAPLLGGVAVIGLAVAFGAQNLIRDFFYGFMILLENQYTINDVVKIGEVGGQVERITLRLTILRDLDGTVHIIPNGEIKRVSNLTQGWSRAVFDIGVGYNEDVDRVMKLLIELGQELRRDPDFRAQILDNPEMLGVESLGESSVVIKFVIKTRPLKQWAVKREMLRRIKRRFDELGIDFPFPQSSVHHHFDGGPKLHSSENTASGEGPNIRERVTNEGRR